MLLLFASLASPAPAQTPVEGLRTAEAPPAPVPFGVGEKLVYSVSLSPFGGVGDGSFEVVELDTIRGHTTYRLRMRVKGGVLFAKVNDHYQSWMDVHSLISRRFQQDQKEVKYERHRTLDFFPEQLRWSRLDKEESGPLPTDRPLDDISFIYYARTLPLEVGRTYTLPQYFHKDGNPVVLKVLRRETVKVPAGTFATIVVQPIIQTKGLFGKGGKAEVYFSDDDRRLLVQMKSDVPVLGSLTLRLERVELGERLSSTSPAQHP
ncbi:MAG TPA: DUF3108 domain-containing protein [Longimicrobiales bacterium]|nr:DUF3108 domain-containing protein [Longimicrobiales bacterium]